MGTRYFEHEEQALLYSKYRPSLPLDLVQKILAFIREKYTDDLTLAIDAGCGSGQATHMIAPYFKRVEACDVSPEQIKFAKARNGMNGDVDYRISPAETIHAPSNSVQLVLACASIHWFDIPKFYAEVGRVLCVDGVLAVVGYGYWKAQWKKDPTKDEEVNRLMNTLLYQTWKRYWPPANALALDDYADIKIPMRDSIRYDIEFERQMRLEDYPKFFRTMSPYRKAEELGDRVIVENQIEKCVDDIMAVLGSGLERSGILFVELNHAYLLMARK